VSLLLTLLAMSAYVAAVAASRRRLHYELRTGARDLRVPAGDPRARGR
jgi:hypothetical protein